MTPAVVKLTLVAAFFCGCSQTKERDITRFSAPDSLGRAVLVSRHDTHPLGEVSFISFGTEPGSIRLVTYFSDGTTVSEPLAYNDVGELQALDGQPRFMVKEGKALRVAGYSNTSSCMNVNLTKPEDPSGN